MWSSEKGGTVRLIKSVSDTPLNSCPFCDIRSSLQTSEEKAISFWNNRSNRPLGTDDVAIMMGFIDDATKMLAKEIKLFNQKPYVSAVAMIEILGIVRGNLRKIGENS